MSSTVELRQLKQFVAVAEELHFRKAAERLNMAQPPLSQSIKKLEDALGVQLLDRSRRNVRLTTAGEAFLDGARRALRAVEGAQSDAVRAAKGLSGHLNIAFVGSATYDVLPSVLRRFRATHPDVELELLEMTTLEQVRGLARERVDIGFLRPPMAGRSMIAERPIRRERLIAVIPETHTAAAEDSLDLRQLATDPFITFPSRTAPNLHSQMLMACYDSGFTPRISQTASQIQTQVSLVAAGLGVALVPECASRLAHQGVLYKAIHSSSDHLFTSLSIAWRSDRETPLLKEFIRECLGSRGLPSE